MEVKSFKTSEEFGRESAVYSAHVLNKSIEQKDFANKSFFCFSK